MSVNLSSLMNMDTRVFLPLVIKLSFAIVAKVKFRLYCLNIIPNFTIAFRYASPTSPPYAGVATNKCLPLKTFKLIFCSSVITLSSVRLLSNTGACPCFSFFIALFFSLSSFHFSLNFLPIAGSWIF